MMLRAEQIERFSRQILVPEIGGRGQERLLAATVAVGGTGIAARQAADLLARAGARVVADGDATGVGVVVRLDMPPSAPAGHVDAPAVLGAAGPGEATLLVLVAAPCPRCAPPELLPGAGPLRDDPATIVAAHALGALAATEALLLVLDPARPSRHVVLDERTGAVRARTLTLAPCRHCRRDT